MDFGLQLRDYQTPYKPRNLAADPTHKRSNTYDTPNKPRHPNARPASKNSSLRSAKSTLQLDRLYVESRKVSYKALGKFAAFRVEPPVFTPKINPSAGHSRVHSTDNSISQRDKLFCLSAAVHNKRMSECSFHPAINWRSRELRRNGNVFAQLHQNAKKSATPVCNPELTFQPTLVSRPPAALLGKKPAR